MKITNVRKLVQIGRGPLATAYCCPYCAFKAVTRKGPRGLAGGGGRGYGLAQGSINHSAVVNHIKAEHADKLAAGEPGKKPKSQM